MARNHSTDSYESSTSPDEVLGGESNVFTEPNDEPLNLTQKSSRSSLDIDMNTLVNSMRNIERLLSMQLFGRLGDGVGSGSYYSNSNTNYLSLNWAQPGNLHYAIDQQFDHGQDPLRLSPQASSEMSPMRLSSQSPFEGHRLPRSISPTDLQGVQLRNDMKPEIHDPSGMINETSRAGRQCSNCSLTATPLWRRDIFTHEFLCNACGIYQRMNNCHRPLNKPKSTRTSRRDGLVCFNCKSSVASLWRRDKDGNTLCNACQLYKKLKGVDRPVSMKKNVIQTRNRKPRVK